MTEPQPAPLQLNPQDVIAELEAIPEARPYWALAQERAARKAVQQQLTEQTNELEKLRQDNTRLQRAGQADDDVVTREL